MPVQKQCEKCSKMFEAVRNSARFCSKACKYAAWQAAHPERVAEIKRKHYDANKEAVIERGKKWAADHPDRIQEIKRKYYGDKREEVIQRSAEWKAAHPEETKAAHEKYSASDKGRDKAYQGVHRRRARKKAVGGTFTRQEFRDLAASLGMICVCCKEVLPMEKLEADHIMPLASGGSNDISNIQPLCQPCNRRKSAKHVNYLDQPEPGPEIH